MSVGCRFWSRTRQFEAKLVVFVSLALALAAPLPSYTQNLSNLSVIKLPASGSYPGAVTLDPAILDSPYLFRFSSTSPWRPFDRVLVLDSFPGEQRQYRLELLSNLSGEVNVFSYRIDRKPPESPTFFPASGDIGPALTIGLHGEGSLMLSLDGEPFAPYNPEIPQTMHAPADGSTIVTALAYARDSHGNTSLPAFASWRLSYLPPEALPSSGVGFLKTLQLSVLDKIDGLSIRVSAEPGTNPTVILDVSEGRVPVISIQSPREELSRASFIRLPTSAGRAMAEVPVPWGYDLELAIRYGYEDADGMVVAGNARPIRAEFPYRGPPAPPQKAPEPVISSAFGASLLSWLPSTMQVYFSIDGSDFIRYQTPVLLPYRGPIPYELSYQAANDGGRSATVSVALQVLPRLDAPSITGVEAGLTYGKAPPLQVSATHGTVRYEMTMDGSDPAPPGVTSPSIVDAPPFAGVDGQIVRYRLRLASVDNSGQIGPERYLDFAIDREAPPVPVLSHTIPAYSANDLILALQPSEPGSFIYLSVTDDGSGAFQEYRGPIVLSGTDDGRKRYVVRAFAEDAFGNRSLEMKPVTVLVDRASLYVDPIGKRGASGTPDDPLPSLQEALGVSATTGRRIIYIRGNHVLTGPIQVDGGLRLLGGYAQDWTASQRERPSIRFSRPLASGTAGIRIRGSHLELRSVGLLSEGTGASVLIDAKDSSLVLAQVSLAMTGGLEATAIKLESSQLVMDDVEVSLSSTVTGRAFDSIDSESTMDKLVISADSTVRLFDALRIAGGLSSLQDLRIDASPALAFSGLSLSRARVSMSGSAFFVRGGASSLRLLHLNAAVLTVDTLFGDISWLGEAELFRLGSSSNLRLAHATVLAKAKRLSVVETRDSTWSIYNSIFNTDSPAAVFAASDRFPAAGSVSANCLWGFASFLNGGGATGTIAELNRYASLGYPNFVEMPSRTFSSTNKGLPLLSSSSACIGAAAPLPWSLPADLKMNLRAPSSRDIGVDGLREGRL
jgi:hypothetical protein